MLRHLGLAARFVSGYLIQLQPDVKPLDGPAGAEHDFTDLHAWADVYLPGAGWVGLDPTSGLLAGEGHLPLAATPDPASAAPLTGAVDPCETEFDFHMEVTRIHEDPRVTRPYSEEQWQRIQLVGEQVDAELSRGDVRLTMGGEPTFVAQDDMEGVEWNTTAAQVRTSGGWLATCCGAWRGGLHRGRFCISGRANGTPANPFHVGRWAVTGGPTASRFGRTAGW